MSSRYSIESSLWSLLWRMVSPSPPALHSLLPSFLFSSGTPHSRHSNAILLHIVPLADLSQAIERSKDQEVLSLRNQVKELTEHRDKLERLGADAVVGVQPIEVLHQPPDFRDLSIVPTSQELLGDRDSHLRKNEVHKPWLSGALYLDTHFRLAREDFVAVSTCIGMQSFTNVYCPPTGPPKWYQEPDSQPGNETAKRGRVHLQKRPRLVSQLVPKRRTPAIHMAAFLHCYPQPHSREMGLIEAIHERISVVPIPCQAQAAIQRMYLCDSDRKRFHTAGKGTDRCALR